MDRITAKSALKHPWITFREKRTIDLKNVRKDFDPLVLYKKAFKTIKVVNNFQNTKNKTKQTLNNESDKKS